MIPKRRFLDPRLARHAEQKPMLDAVNIPLDEIEDRTYELPDKDTVIEVTGPDGYVAEAVVLLRTLGRQAKGVNESECQYTDPDKTEPAGRLWEPNSFLADRLKHIKPGVALDMGCGSGRDALYMASLGWQVTAVDRLDSALEMGKTMAQRYGVADKVEWVEADLRTFNTDKQFNLITCFFYFDAGQIRRTLSHLAPGGSVLLETFSPEHQRRYKKPKDSSKLLSPEIAKKTLGAMAMRYSDTGNFGGDRWTTRVHAVWELDEE